MKKSIFIAVIGAASAVACYGQGKVIFSNYYSSSQTTGVYYGDGPAAGLFCGPEMTATLLYGDSTATSIAQLSPVPGATALLGYGYATGPDAIATGAGWFQNQTVTVDAGAGGTTYAFAIMVSGMYQGTDYIGYSQIGYGATQSGLGNVPTIPANVQQNSFAVTMVPVPEPGTLALAGLGGFGMLMAFRRKKALDRKSVV